MNPATTTARLSCVWLDQMYSSSFAWLGGEALWGINSGIYTIAPFVLELRRVVDFRWCLSCRSRSPISRVILLWNTIDDVVVSRVAMIGTPARQNDAAGGDEQHTQAPQPNGVTQTIQAIPDDAVDALDPRS